MPSSSALLDRPSHPHRPPRPTARTLRRRRLAALALTLALLGVAVAATAVTLLALRGDPVLERLASGSGLPTGIPVVGPPAALGDEDGFIDTGESVSPFADELPAIARLDPDLRAAMQAAASAAIADGVDFVVTSGWRSERYQQALFDDAVREYGSVDEASRFVAAATGPTASRHVSGEAVDIGYTDADSWLQQHGADYGLCQTFANEMWHFELATTPGGECPTPYSDASQR